MNRVRRSRFKLQCNGTCKHKILDLILREGLKQRIFKNTAIRIFGPKSEESKDDEGIGT